MLFYVMHIVLSVLWKLLEGPGSGGVALPARKRFILDFHAVQHFLIGYKTEKGGWHVMNSEDRRQATQ